MLRIATGAGIVDGPTSADRYQALNFKPKLVADFIQNYYRKNGTPTDFDGLITHTRAGLATMTDSDGVLKWCPHNLLTYSEDFSNAAWTKVGSVTVTDLGAGEFRINGFSDAAGDRFTQTTTLSPTTVTAEVQLRGEGSDIGKAITLTAKRIGGTFVQSTDIITLTAEWQTATATFVMLSDNTGATFTLTAVSDPPSAPIVRKPRLYRSDLGGMVNNPATGDSYVPTTSAARYLPRIGNHVYESGAWVNAGLLHESESKTNLLLNSNTLSTQDVTVTAAAHTLHFTGTGTVTLSGTSTAGPLVGTGTGEENRVALSFTPTAGTLTVTVTGTVTNAQLELGTQSSYIPTNGATATRASDTLTIDAANMPDYQEPVYLGPELVTDGDFSSAAEWVLTDATISGGALTADAATSVADQSIDFTIGKVYAVSISISGRTAGDVDVGVGTYAAGLNLTASSEFIQVCTNNTNGLIIRMQNSFDGSVESVSVREIKPLAVSLALDGRATWSDTGALFDVEFFRWASGAGSIKAFFRGSSDTLQFEQLSGDGVFDSVSLPSFGGYAPGVNVPFSIASRHGSTFINGAVDGTALTVNATPTSIADLSATDFVLGFGFNGNLGRLLGWPEDITDEGMEAVSDTGFSLMLYRDDDVMTFRNDDVREYR